MDFKKKKNSVLIPFDHFFLGITPDNDTNENN